MPAIKNTRWEKYCQFRMQGRTIDASYVMAGFKRDDANAARLERKPAIRARIAELQARAADKAEWTAADRLMMLRDIATKTQAKDPRVTVSAVAEANKMQGSYAPTRHEHAGKNGGPIQHVDLSKVSGDDLDQLERIFGPLAGSGDDDAADPGGEGA